MFLPLLIMSMTFGFAYISLTHMLVLNYVLVYDVEHTFPFWSVSPQVFSMRI